MVGIWATSRSVQGPLLPVLDKLIGCWSGLHARQSPWSLYSFSGPIFVFVHLFGFYLEEQIHQGLLGLSFGCVLKDRKFRWCFGDQIWCWGSNIDGSMHVRQDLDPCSSSSVPYAFCWWRWCSRLTSGELRASGHQSARDQTWSVIWKAIFNLLYLQPHTFF